MRSFRPGWALTSIILLICLTGCVKSLHEDYDDFGLSDEAVETSFIVPESIDPEEMYQWEPPSENELEARRLRQKELDSLTAEIEKLVFGFDELELAARNLDGGQAAWDQKLAELDHNMLARIAELEKLNKASGEKVASLKGSVSKLQNELQAIIRARDSKRFNEGKYRTAFILFRDKKFLDAAAQFLRVLKSRYPSHLRDNILFGTGASFYKLRKWKQAAKSLETLVKEVPKGDKWQEASLLLALTHYRDAQRSRALFILHKAMERNPPPRIRHLMERLEKRIQEDPSVGITQ